MHSGRRIASNYLWLPDGWLRRPLVEFDAAGRVVRLAHLAGEADRSVATEFWAGVLLLLPEGRPEVGVSGTDVGVGVPQGGSAGTVGPNACSGALLPDAEADDATCYLPLDPDRETLCELVRRRVAGQLIRLAAPVTDAGMLRGVIGTLRRAQEATDAPLHEVVGWWAAVWGDMCVANGTETAVGADEADGLPDRRTVAGAVETGDAVTSRAGGTCGMPMCEVTDVGEVTDGTSGVPMWGAAARLVLLAGLDYERMRLTPQSELRILV